MVYLGYETPIFATERQRTHFPHPHEVNNIAEPIQPVARHIDANTFYP